MRHILKVGDIQKDSGFVIVRPDFNNRVKAFRRHAEISDPNEFIRHIQFRNYIPYIESIITDEGDPITVSSVPAYYLDDELLDDLPKRQRKEVLNWIKNNIFERKTLNFKYHTYHLKHLIQWDTGIYMTENQMKDAMLQLGYYPNDKYERSWVFNIGFYDNKKIENLEKNGILSSKRR